MTNLKDKLIKISAKLIGHARYVVIQMGEAVVPKIHRPVTKSP